MAHAEINFTLLLIPAITNNYTSTILIDFTKFAAFVLNKSLIPKQPNSVYYIAYNGFCLRHKLYFI